MVAPGTVIVTVVGVLVCRALPFSTVAVEYISARSLEQVGDIILDNYIGSYRYTSLLRAPYLLMNPIAGLRLSLSSK